MALSNFSGGLDKTQTEVSVDTAILEINDTRLPRIVSHDWRDAEDRRTIAEGLFLKTFQQFVWNEAEKGRVPHARELHLVWSNGEKWLIRLDQGFGYWRASSRQRREFPFDRVPERQIDNLVRMTAVVEPACGDYPTYWYSGPVTAYGSDQPESRRRS